MSIEYCFKCGKNIDTDYDAEHFLEGDCKKMLINIVTEPAPGWILRKWAERFLIHWPKGAGHIRVTSVADPEAAVNVYINYALFKAHTGIKGKEICVFTHRERDPVMANVFDHAAVVCDHCIAQCENTAKLLPPHKTSVLHMPPDNIFIDGTPLRVGIIGRTYPTGRKNENWLPELEKIDGIEIVSTYDNPVPFEKMPLFYKNLDYVLIIASNEGGPMPVLEALATHKPVIAPNVGLSWEYPVVKYDGTLKGAKETLSKLVIKGNVWDQAAKRLNDIILTVVSN